MQERCVLLKRMQERCVLLKRTFAQPCGIDAYIAAHPVTSQRRGSSSRWSTPMSCTASADPPPQIVSLHNAYKLKSQLLPVTQLQEKYLRYSAPFFTTL